MTVSIVFVAFAEILSIGSVVPFLGVLIDREKTFSHPYAQPLISALGITTPSQIIFPVTVIFVTVFLMAALIRLAFIWAQTRLSYAIGAELAIKIYRRTLYQPYIVHINRNSSEVISGISNKINMIVGYAIMPILGIISAGLVTLATLITLIFIEPKIALGAIISFAITYISLALFTQKRVAQLSNQISYGSNQTLKTLQEGLGGIRDVIIDGTQELYSNAYLKADLPLRQAQANVHIISVSPRYVVEALGVTLIAWVAYFSLDGSSETSNTIPILGALALAAQRLLPGLQQAYSGWISIRASHASLADVLLLLDQPMPTLAFGSSDIPFKKHIIFKQISYRYAENLPWVLQDVSFQVSKGSRIGFIGTTGSGKTTLMDVAMGILEPTRGIILVDGQRIRKTNQSGWHKHVAHVPQSVFLVDASVAENIALGEPVGCIDYGRVRDAANQAHIASTIESWVEGYHTTIGERGVKLSGGQRQRIGIARALYKKTDLIIFDEATSALDNKTEQLIMESIDNLGGNKTVFIVAHRLSTLKNCTQIIELKEGMVSKIGTYSEIIEANK